MRLGVTPLGKTSAPLGFMQFDLSHMRLLFGHLSQLAGVYRSFQAPSIP